MTKDGVRHGVHAGRVTSGLIILLLGALMLVDRHDVFGRDAMRFFPGMVLIVMGAARLLWGDSDCRRGRRTSGGFWLVFIGAWLIVNEAHVVGLTYHNSWPILIIGAGVLIVLRELAGPRDDAPAENAGSPERR